MNLYDITVQTRTGEDYKLENLSSTCKEKNDIKWNFTKFLVDQEGNVVYRLSPIEDPCVLEDKIKELLGE